MNESSILYPSFAFFFLSSSYLTLVDHSTYNTVLPLYQGCSVQTVRHYPDPRPWSELTERTFSFTTPAPQARCSNGANRKINFGICQELNQGPFCTIVKGLNHCATILFIISFLNLFLFVCFFLSLIQSNSFLYLIRCFKKILKYTNVGFFSTHSLMRTVIQIIDFFYDTTYNNNNLYIKLKIKYGQIRKNVPHVLPRIEYNQFTHGFLKARWYTHNKRITIISWSSNFTGGFNVFPTCVIAS